MTIGHMDAAADALVAYLQATIAPNMPQIGTTGTLAGVVVMRGWPDTQDFATLGTRERLRIAVTHGQGSETPHAPSVNPRTTASVTPGMVAQTTSYARWSGPMQVDAWTNDREGRDQSASIIRDALTGTNPNDSALVLVSTGYRNDRVRYTVASSEQASDADAVLIGRWRMTWLIGATGAIVRVADIPALAEEFAHIDGESVTIATL